MPGSGQELTSLKGQYKPFRESSPAKLSGFIAKHKESHPADGGPPHLQDAVSEISSSEKRQSSNDVYQAQGNKYQKEAIRHFTGPCEVLAGPGSGKTFVLVERILYLIRYYHMDPSRILVLTFSRAAAIEMRQRFQKRSLELNPSPYPVTFGTFHSVFFRILQESFSMQQEEFCASAGSLHFSGGGGKPAIISSDRQNKLVSSLLSRYKEQPVTGEDVREALSLISRYKMNQTLPAKGSGDPDPVRELLADYDHYLRENGLLDFEDMIGQCGEMLQSHPDLLHYWQERFQFLLADEFQDINAGQFRVLQMLAGKRRNLFVVGDDDQAIYGFRGSDPEFMLKFRDVFPDAAVVRLSINYRCSPEIIEAAGKVIAVNQNRLVKDIRPDGFAVREPDPVKLYSASSEADQYEQICWILSGMEPEDRRKAAVIVRVRMELSGLTRCLDSRGIPWREKENSGRNAASEPRCGGQRTVTGGTPGAGGGFGSFRISKEISGALSVAGSYFQLAASLGDGPISRKDLLAVVNVPERFLLRSVFRREYYREEELMGLYPSGTEEWSRISELVRSLHVLARLSPGMGYRYLKRQILGDRAASLFRLADADWTILDRAIAETAAACRTCKDFAAAAKSMDPRQIFQKAAAEMDEHRTGGGGPQSRPSGVLLLTMHGSKGLEFDTVIVPDLNEGILPNRRAVTESAVEEERRLFYVAMTRARKRLILIYIRGTKDNPRRPSRFLEPLGIEPWT